jgi:hypothetical protein
MAASSRDDTVRASLCRATWFSAGALQLIAQALALGPIPAYALVDRRLQTIDRRIELFQGVHDPRHCRCFRPLGKILTTFLQYSSMAATGFPVNNAQDTWTDGFVRAMRG